MRITLPPCFCYIEQAQTRPAQRAAMPLGLCAATTGVAAAALAVVITIVTAEGAITAWT
jgi:hypothetical protein